MQNFVPQSLTTHDVYSVTRLNRAVRDVLGESFPILRVRGEISNLVSPASGHLYFTLKDATAQVRCVLFRTKKLLLSLRPANGDQVLVRARLSCYEPRGDFQLVVEYLELDGEGALQLEIERRKRLLSEEGVFAEESKRPLPLLPRQVGVITSPSGAAVHDVVSVLGRRCRGVPVIIYPAQVQGDAAVSSVCAALSLANARAECDVLILARGGGSLEDLAAFNEVEVARAIRASAIPVVTGVGHEIDVTIADLAADRRAATPSAAAELVVPVANQVLVRTQNLSRHMMERFSRNMLQNRQKLGMLERQLRYLHPVTRLEQQAQRLDRAQMHLGDALGRVVSARVIVVRSLERRLQVMAPGRLVAARRGELQRISQRQAWGYTDLLRGYRERVTRASAALSMCGPRAVLERGYAIVSAASTGKVITGVEQVQPGMQVRVRLARGDFVAHVDKPVGDL